MDVRDLLAQIRAYTAKHKELAAAHHFTFHLPVVQGPRDGCYLVVGMNPGETEEDLRNFPAPAEESSERDFHKEIAAKLGQENRGRANWEKQVGRYVGERSAYQTEFFFWSSANAGAAFLERFGSRMQDSKHLQFCAGLNLQLVRAIKPVAVLAPGLTHAQSFAPLYGLRHKTTSYLDGKRLVEHYEQDDGTPWLFTKHWTGAFGFTNEQRAHIQTYIATIDPPVA